VQHLEPGKETLGVPQRTEDAWNQNAEELVQAQPVLIGLVYQLAKALADEPPHLARQSRRQRHLQLHQRFERGAAAVAVILAKRSCDPIGVIGEQVREPPEVRDQRTSRATKATSRSSSRSISSISTTTSIPPSSSCG
jgi:hypothetical protein